jgi:hypothetical protein
MIKPRKITDKKNEEKGEKYQLSVHSTAAAAL